MNSSSACARCAPQKYANRRSTSRRQCRFLYCVAVFCLTPPRLLLAQNAPTPATDLDTPPYEAVRQASVNPPVESEIVVEGLASYGHYKLLGSGSGCHLYTAGFEYDRHSWGRFLGARVDYTAEFLPLVLLDTAATSDIWGTPTSTNRKIVPGIGISPIGFRLVWFDHKRLKPYLTVKGGMLGFTQKVLSQKATYENISFQSGVGLLVKMNQRIDLRLGLFSDFHFSDGFIVPVNPGLDVMNANLGISYRIGQRTSH
jgi:Lipid A 3-O-deacylase (PagL)